MRKADYISLAVVVVFLMEIIIQVSTYDPVTKIQISYKRYGQSYKIADEKIEEVAPVQQDIPVIDEEELDLLSRLIYAEAGSTSCSSEARYLVGAVALNRVKSEEYPDNLWDVVYQDEPCLQYACVKDGNLYQQPTEECVQIAYELLVNGSDIPETVIFQSGFLQGSGVYKYIDNIYFCYR